MLRGERFQPARGKPKALQPLQRRPAELPEAHDADPAAGGGGDLDLLPDLAPLLVAEARQVAVQGEHRQRHIFDHARGDARLQHAHQRHMVGNLRKIELVDAGTDREDQLQVRKGRRDVVRRHPGGEVAHRGGVADVGPQAEGQVGRQRRDMPSPFRAAHGIGLVEKRHRGLGGCLDIRMCPLSAHGITRSASFEARALPSHLGMRFVSALHGGSRRRQGFRINRLCRTVPPSS